MEAVERAFLLGVGLVVDNNDVERVVEAVEKRLSEVPALKLKIEGLLDLERLAQTAQRVTQQTTSAAAEATKLGQAAQRATKEVATGVEGTVATVMGATARMTQQAIIDAEKMAGQVESAVDRSISRIAKGTGAAASAMSSPGQLFTSKNALDNLLNHFDTAHAAGGVAQFAEAGRRMDESLDEAIRNRYNGKGTPSAGPVSSLTQLAGARQMVDSIVDTHDTGVARAAQVEQETHARKMLGAQVREQMQDDRESLRLAEQEERAMQRRTETLNQYVPKLQSVIAQQQAQNRQLPEMIRNYHSFADELVNDAGKVAMWTVATGAIFGAMHSVQKGFGDAVHAEKQQAIAQLYREAQHPNQKQTPEQVSMVNDTVMNEAIAIARVYGAEVSHVIENIGVWQKVTKGDLHSAILMSNEATKMATVSGMNLNEVYRSTTAALAQLHLPLTKTKELYSGVTEMALKYAGGMQSLEGESQDTARQILEGIDRSAAVLSRAGMGMADMGAAVAVLNTVVNESGESLAGHLSAGFAALLEGKPRAEMHKLGIDVQHTKDLVGDLAKAWPEHGAELLKGMRKQDQEVLTALMDRVDMFHKARDDFRKAMADADKGNSRQDHVIETMMDTTQFGFNQVRANIESAAIAIGKSFLPQARELAAWLNGGLLPGLIANREALAHIAKDLAMVGGAFAAAFAAKTITAMVMRAAADMGTFGKVVASSAGGFATFEAAAQMSLSGYQRALLQAATGTTSLTVEMEESVKVMAVRYGVSIDAVILKMLELRGVAQTTATGVELSDLAMATAMERTAAMTGKSVTVMEEEFATLEATTKRRAAGMQAAFAAMIPVIGEVALAAMGIDFAVGFAKDKWKEHQENRLHDPATRHQMEAATADDYAAQARTRAYVQKKIDSMGWENRPGTDRFDPVMRGLIQQRDAAQARMDHDRADISTFRHAGDETPEHRDRRVSFQDSQNNVKKIMHDFDTRWAHERGLDTVPGGPGKPLTDKAPETPTKVKGASTEASRQAEATKELNVALLQRERLMQAALQSDDLAIGRAEIATRRYGMQGGALVALTAAINRKITDEQRLAVTEDQIASAHSARAAKLKADSVKAGGMKTSQGVSLASAAQGEIDKANAAETKAIEARNKVLDLQARIAQQIQDATDRMLKQIFNEKTNPATSGLIERIKQQHVENRSKYHTDAGVDKEAALEDSLAVIEDIQSQQASQAGSRQVADELKRSAQAHRDAATALRQSAEDDRTAAETIRDGIKNEIQNLSIEAISPFDKGLATALRDAKTMQDTYDRDSLAYTKAGNVEGQRELDIWRQKKVAIIESALALSEYERHKKLLEDSLGWQIFDKTLSSVGNTVGKDLLDNVSGDRRTKDQYTSLEAQISWLEQQKGQLVGQQYVAQRAQLDSQIHALQDRVKQLKDLEAHPSFIKTLLKDIDKSVIDATIKKAEDSLKKSIEEAFLGKPKTELDQQRDALRQAQEKLTNIIRDDGRGYAKTTDVLKDVLIDGQNSFARKVDKLSDAMSSSSSGGGDGMAQFYGASNGSLPNAAAVAMNPGLAGDIYSSSTNYASLPAAMAALGGAGGGRGGGGMMAALGAFLGGPAGAGLAAVFGATAAGGAAGGGQAGNYLGAGIGSILGLGTAGFISLLAGGGGTAIGLGDLFAGAALGPIGIGAAVIGAMVGGGMIGPHWGTPDKYPDRSDTAHYGQWNSDMQGVTGTYNGTTIAPEQQYDSLHGGKSLEQQLADFAANKSNWNNASDAQKAELQRILDLEGGQGAKGLAISNEKQGIDTLASGQQISVTDYQKLSGDISNLMATVKSNANGQFAPILSFNGYGGRGVSSGTGGSLYNTPGMNSGDLSQILSTMPYAVNPSVNGPTGPTAQQSPNQTVNVTVPVKVELDGYTLYESNNAYTRQSNGMGYGPNSN